MKFKVGDLVWITSAFDGQTYHSPPAIIISAYKDFPKIFLHNERENRKWLEEEDIGVGNVYDIMHEGRIEEAVLEEWLQPYEKNKKRGRLKSPPKPTLK